MEACSISLCHRYTHVQTVALKLLSVVGFKHFFNQSHDGVDADVELCYLRLFFLEFLKNTRVYSFPIF